MSIILNKHHAKYKVNTTLDKGVTKVQKVRHGYAIGTPMATPWLRHWRTPEIPQSPVHQAFEFRNQFHILLIEYGLVSYRRTQQVM